jgi:Ca2+-binding RTX toxin-like protein
MHPARPVVVASIVLAAAFVAVPASGSSAKRHASCHGHQATIIGTQRADQLVGTKGPDVIVARGGDDHVNGRGGHDIICGGTGADVIAGGAGNDVEWGGSGADTLIGSGGDDVLVSGPAHNTLIGGMGNDVLVSSKTSDRLLFADTPVPSSSRPVRVDLRAGTAVGQGHDRINIKNPDAGAFVQVAPGSVVRGTDNDDVFRGSGSRFFGRGGNDQVYGASTAHGGPGNDFFQAIETAQDTRAPRFYGGVGDDQLQTSTAVLPDMVVDGGPGDDVADLGFAQSGTTSYNRLTVNLSAQAVIADSVSFPLRSFNRVSVITAGLVALSYEIDGTEQADTISFMGPASVTVRGLGGDDVIATAGGADYIDGGDGTDTADAGPGVDTCVSVEVPYNCESVTP